MPAAWMRVHIRKEGAALNAAQRAAVCGFVAASQLCSWPACRPLAHMDLRACTLKRDFVHHQLHQVDAATVLGLQSFDRQRVWNRFRIKPLPVVRDDNGHSLSQLALTTNVNQLAGVYPVAVNDGIAQRFVKRQLNGGLAACNAARSFNQPHQPVNQRRDGFDLTRHPSLDFEQRSTRASPGKTQPQTRPPIRHLCSSHSKAPLSPVPAKVRSARNQTVQILCCSAASGTTCSISR